MIEIQCSFRTGIGRYDTYDYVRTVSIDVIGYDYESRVVTVGKATVEQIMVLAAEIDGEVLFDVFDADSQGLHDVYAALFTASGELQGELDITEMVEDVLYLRDAMFHPSVEPFVPGILESVATLFGEASIFVMGHAATGLADAPLSESGFKKIAGTDFLFRHTAFTTPYSRAHPRGVESHHQFTANREQEEWVLANWKNEHSFKAQ